MKAGFFQFRPRFGQIEENTALVETALAGVDADLIVLPELAFTGYCFRDRVEAMSLSEPVSDSPTLDRLASLCQRENLYLVTGFTERYQDQLFNSSVMLEPNGNRHVYRKLHLFNTEKNIFDPGDIPLSVQVIEGVGVGMMVCFDWAFPEVTRSLALLGADVICQPSNLVLGFCQQAMKTRCLENRVYAITANRYGADKRPHTQVKFTGRSQIVAPGGEVVGSAHAQRDGLFVTEIDTSLSRNKMITDSNNLLADRRPEFYL